MDRTRRGLWRLTHMNSIAMRTPIMFLLLVLLVSPAVAQNAATDSTGLPGDHFSLQGALELFKGSKNLEAFEQALNTEDQRVNNLDLDGNGEVDYVRVVDHTEGQVHAITIQVAVSKDEVQDVAAIELEKNGSESAVLQIRGAEDLYGTDAIIEPFEEKEEAPATKGPSSPEDAPRVRVWVNVWSWPCVMWIYGPTYVVWSSPWYYGYYPPHWHPWRPWGWNAWYGWHRPYHGWYHPVHTCRVVHAHAVYQHRAMHSPTVRARNAAIRNNRPVARPADRKEGSRSVSPARNAKPDRSIQRPARNQRTTPRPSTKPGRSTAPSRTKGR